MQRLTASLSVSAASSDWFQQFPTPDIHFQGPDFDSILSRFQSLDLSSIAQALQLIVTFVKGLKQPGTAIGDVLAAKLPLINQSLSRSSILRRASPTRSRPRLPTLPALSSSSTTSSRTPSGCRCRP